MLILCVEVWADACIRALIHSGWGVNRGIETRSARQADACGQAVANLIQANLRRI